MQRRYGTQYGKNHPSDNFFLWGYVKVIVYKSSVPSLDEVKLKIVLPIEANAGEHLGRRGC
jgi:hypothetical protein